MVGRYHKTAPALARWLEENIPEALTVCAFPAAHRKRLRTNNGLERLNKEIKRRTRVATLFPNLEKTVDRSGAAARRNAPPESIIPTPMPDANPLATHCLFYSSRGIRAQPRRSFRRCASIRKEPDHSAPIAPRPVAEAASAIAAIAMSAPPSPAAAGEPAPTGIRPRPALFRALGQAEPPVTVEIGGAPFRLLEVLKHDSWAATAIYASTAGKALCKFNRRQPILSIPMAWLGRRLAARERHFHTRLTGVVGIPAHLGPVSVDGTVLPHAFAREFIEGHVLDHHQPVDDDFFPRFATLLADVHHRDVAHVDLHKRENVLVDQSGCPWLIDFQISFSLPTRHPLLAAPLRGLLRILQQCDDYHLLKHHLHHRPDQTGLAADEIDRRRPWWIRLHRRFAVPFRTLRRQLLVWMGIRGRSGQVSTEAFPEVAHQRHAA